METVIRIQPCEYIHVLDTNENVTKVVVGPKTYTKQDHQHIVLPPTKMVNVPPRHYVTIFNPHQRQEGNPILDANGTVKLAFGDTEIRLTEMWPDPFPLYPGEVHVGGVKELTVVEKYSALRIRALRDFKDGVELERKAGDVWLFKGPATYTPRVEEEVVDTCHALTIKSNSALKLRALKDCTDVSGEERKVGEEWLVRQVGTYLPAVDEEVVSTMRAHILTEKKALHLRASKTYKDVYGIDRHAGQEWLVTLNLGDTHLEDVYEEVIGTVQITTLTQRQFCVVVNYYDDINVQRLGCKKLIKGEKSFFLKPGERLTNGIQDIYVLAEDEALLLQALQRYTEDTNSGTIGASGSRHAGAADGGGESAGADEKETEHQAGDRWMVYGPCEYVPSVEVEVLERRKAMPLDENEGVYVRDMKSGLVRSVIGTTYMLRPDEELWEKVLSQQVELLLERQSGGNVYLPPTNGESKGDGSKEAARKLGISVKSMNRSMTTSFARDRTRVIAFRVPHNAAVQVYDYKAKRQRIVFGPELVMLDPNEQLTTLSLSGSRPKKPDVIQTLCLMLGPDFMTDVVTVETCDHARLSLQLAYNWNFELDRSNPQEVGKIFNVRDFVGDAAKAMASRIRAAVASETFDNFHKYSARLIRQSIFGVSEDGKIGGQFKFKSNNLVITNVDIQAVEPVDERTRESLQRSVQLAIEITTASQEAKAKHEAKREAEEAKGALEQQSIKNDAMAEGSKLQLIELQAESSIIEACGAARAEAQASTQAATIEGEAAVKQAELHAQALRIETEAKVMQLRAEHAAEIEHTSQLIKLEVEKAKELAEIESQKFKQTVDTIGADTIAKIAQAGPEMQARLLQGLGLKGFLVTDGKNPVNLFQTAQGFVGGQGGIPGSA
jgi:major vault protein